METTFERAEKTVDQLGGDEGHLARHLRVRGKVLHGEK